MPCPPDPGPLFGPGALLVAILFTAVLAAAFIAWPGVDLWLAGLTRDDRGGFILAGSRAGWRIRQVLELTYYAALPLLALSFGMKLLAPSRRPLIRLKPALYIVLCLAVGPGLVVNVIFKEQWGRPRPNELALFDPQQTATFQAAWIVGDQCRDNCSFVSGEASTGFVYLALVPFVPRRRQALAAAAAVSLGFAVGALRMLQGGHFFSDVVFSGLITYLTVLGLYLLLFRPGPAWLSEAALAGAMIRLHDVLRRLRPRIVMNLWLGVALCLGDPAASWAVTHGPTAAQGVCLDRAGWDTAAAPGHLPARVAAG